MLRIEKILLTFNKIEERLRKTNDAIIKLKEVTTTLKKTIYTFVNIICEKYFYIYCIFKNS